MEFKQLEMFVAVAEERSVLRAAQRVYRTQPAVSMSMSKLEQEVGMALFDRSPRRRFDLTPVGRVLCAYAKRMLELREEAQRAVLNCTQEVVSE